MISYTKTRRVERSAEAAFEVSGATRRTISAVKRQCAWFVVLSLALAGCAGEATGSTDASPSTEADTGTAQSEQFTPTITYSLPDDWANVEDFPSNFAVAPGDDVCRSSKAKPSTRSS